MLWYENVNCKLIGLVKFSFGVYKYFMMTYTCAGMLNYIKVFVK